MGGFFSSFLFGNTVDTDGAATVDAAAAAAAHGGGTAAGGNLGDGFTASAGAAAAAAAAAGGQPRQLAAAGSTREAAASVRIKDPNVDLRELQSLADAAAQVGGWGGLARLQQLSIGLACPPACGRGSGIAGCEMWCKRTRNLQQQIIFFFCEA